MNSDATLHFKCDACGVHLGVDSSLAGTEAPCPKCGALVLAPMPSQSGRGTVGSSSVTGAENLEMSYPSIDTLPERRRIRKTEQGGEYVPSKTDKAQLMASLKTLFKALLLISVIILIVLAVTWFLKNQ